MQSNDGNSELSSSKKTESSEEEKGNIRSSLESDVNPNYVNPESTSASAEASEIGRPPASGDESAFPVSSAGSRPDGNLVFIPRARSIIHSTGHTRFSGDAVRDVSHNVNAPVHESRRNIRMHHMPADLAHASVLNFASRALGRRGVERKCTNDKSQQTFPEGHARVRVLSQRELETATESNKKDEQPKSDFMTIDRAIRVGSNNEDPAKRGLNTGDSNQGRPIARYAYQGRPIARYANPGRPIARYAIPGRPIARYANQGRPITRYAIEIEPNTEPTAPRGIHLPETPHSNIFLNPPPMFEENPNQGNRQFMVNTEHQNAAESNPWHGNVSNANRVNLNASDAPHSVSSGNPDEPLFRYRPKLHRRRRFPKHYSTASSTDESDEEGNHRARAPSGMEGANETGRFSSAMTTSRPCTVVVNDRPASSESEQNTTETGAVSEVEKDDSKKDGEKKDEPDDESNGSMKPPDSKRRRT